MIALSAAQSFVQTFIHNAILLINTFNNAWSNQAYWLANHDSKFGDNCQ